MNNNNNKIHLFIPDTQVRPGVCINHLNALGNYIAHIRPDVIVQAGDFADMHSLSSYDVGRRAGEGARYEKDIQAATRAMEALMSPIAEYNEKRKRQKERQYRPELHLTLGNHENRINKHIDNYPILEGRLSTEDLPYRQYGWNVYAFLEVAEVDGISYSHYFPRNAAGRIVQTRNGSPNARVQVQREGRSCTSGHLQGLDIHFQQRAERIDTGIIAGCLTPDHKVLTADLEYKPIGDLKVGDKLVSFDEFPNEDGKRSRRFKTGILLQAEPDTRDLYLVRLQSGKTFKVTEDHGWLVKTGSLYRWTTTDKLRKGTNIPKFFDEWETDKSYEAGWLAGMYDGEGSLYIRPTTGGNSTQLSLTQKLGSINDKIITTLKHVCQVHIVNECVQNDVQNTRIVGGQREIAKVLGMIRPERLLNKFTPDALGRINCPDSRNDVVVDVIPVGKGTIIKTDVDCKTMIVEGYPQHNSFYMHDEDYLSPQGTAYKRGVIVKHEVNNGNYDPMVVSLRYLLDNWWDGTDRYA